MLSTAAEGMSDCLCKPMAGTTHRGRPFNRPLPSHTGTIARQMDGSCVICRATGDTSGGDEISISLLCMSCWQSGNGSFPNNSSKASAEKQRVCCVTRELASDTVHRAVDQAFAVGVGRILSRLRVAEAGPPDAVVASGK